jgi:hypothetical protein
MNADQEIAEIPPLQAKTGLAGDPGDRRNRAESPGSERPKPKSTTGRQECLCHKSISNVPQVRDSDHAFAPRAHFL